MVKIISILCLVVLIFISRSFSQRNSIGALLYSQTTIASNGSSITSHKYSENQWHQIADDFTATSDWEINQVVIVGMDADILYSGFNIYFYKNNNGTPDSLVYYGESHLYSIEYVYYFIWYITISLEIPAELTAGEYFISVQSQSSGNILIWTQTNDSFENVAMFRSTPSWLCSTFWVPINNGNCPPAVEYTDMYFELYGSQAVPVELTSFTASAIDNNVELILITATETNNNGFEIFRSALSANKAGQNGNNQWERIGFIEGHGTTTESKVYTFTDKNVVTGKYKYRVKQIDFDGTFEYSKIIEVEVTSPSTFSFEQNYPNPFNPSTKISYQLPVSSDVTLKVYDVLGNEVATLVDENKPSGSYEVEFDASNLPSGPYFYQLRAGSFIETKKMIFIK